MHNLVIDTDPGVDDALALLMANAHRDARIEAITITAGNVGIEHTVRNALKLAEVMGCDAAIFPGAAVPLVATPEDAAFVHGRDGFGDVGFDDPRRTAETEHAANALVRLARERPGELTYVMLGPLTNLALALRLDPMLPSRVKRLVVMGGAVTGRGNIDRLPVEFNIGFDPEAAHVVFSSWPCFELVDWEATMAHGVETLRVVEWLSGTHDAARFYQAISRKTRTFLGKLRGADHWHAADALAMAAVLEPAKVAEWAAHHVAVDVSPGPSRGATIVDWNDRGGGAVNARIMRRFDGPAFERLLRSALGQAL